jgi:glycosyltransferase involved in cell wall biosynthesis
LSRSLKIIIVTPWFGEFSGGAEVLARGLAVELNKRAVETIVFTTCSKSPYDSWWDDFYEEGVYKVYGVQTHRFSVNNSRGLYESAVEKYVKGGELSEKEKEDFFISSINSDRLTKTIGSYLADGWETIALPYFQGLTHTLVKNWPGRISIIPCFHDEDQFYWETTRMLLRNAKHVFFNSIEEKSLCIKIYGKAVGRKIVEGVVTGGGAEAPLSAKHARMKTVLPESYFLFVGRKDKGKNVHNLCDWFLRYRNKHVTKTKLIFVGGGDASILPEVGSISDYGVLGEGEKADVVMRSKGVINLSEKESFSLVIMESWLQGKPVVVSGNCEVTKGHVIRANGGLYPRDADEFGACLSFLENNPAVADMLGNNGKAYVENCFSYDKVLEKYLRVLCR